MKKFLFITHITPLAKRSVLRQALIDAYYKALEAQIYPHWKAIIMDEADRVDGKYHYFRLAAETLEEKHERLKEILKSERFLALAQEADYIVKLDDDDLISPTLLEKASLLDTDVYFDRYHTFYDSSSGVITQQERPWMASTCIHKRECILSEWKGEGATAVGNLLYSYHSKSWHLYYKDKRQTIAGRTEPVYLRVLSPTSITSGALHGPPKVIADVSLPKYYEYLATFGDWKPAAVKGFDAYLPALSAAWQSFAGRPQEKLPSGFFEKKDKSIRAKLKRILSAIRNGK